MHDDKRGSNWGLFGYMLGVMLTVLYLAWQLWLR